MNSIQIKDKKLLDNEISLKGILAVLIIISHSTIGGKISYHSFSLSNLNYFIVAVFFFLSGFGLMEKKKTMKHLILIIKLKN